ncbi:MAG: diguanylate cyclase [Acidobacteriota bacterium]
MKNPESQTIEPEVIDSMTEVELLVKYQAFPQAIEKLQNIIGRHPAYLPAKEALREIHMMKGEREQAEQLAREIALTRQDLARQRAANESLPAEQGPLQRQLSEEIDAIIREIYTVQSVDEVQKLAARRLVEGLQADRCLIFRFSDDPAKARVYEYCRGHVQGSAGPQTAPFHRRLLHLMSSELEPLVIDEAMKDPRTVEYRSLLEAHQIHSVLASPLMHKTKMIGFIVVQNCTRPIPWSESARTLFTAVANHVAVAIGNAQQFSEVQTLAITDRLTGVYNRRFFDERLPVEIRTAQQQAYPLSLALLDIDHFKQINDQWGHGAGDRILHKVGFLLKTSLRKGSVVARYGGEEFAIILPNTTLHTAHFVLENIRRLVESSIATEDGKPLTVSIGLYEAQLSSPEDTTALQTELIQRADKNLYKAKHGGRNRVCSDSH